MLCDGIDPELLGPESRADKRIRFLQYGEGEIKGNFEELNNEMANLISPGYIPSPYYSTALDHELCHQPIKKLIAYADSDCIDAGGNRVKPSFKPDWSPDYFLEYDYIGGVIAVSASLLAANLTTETLPIPELLRGGFCSRRPLIEAVHNFVVAHTQADFLCFLNNDMEIFDGEWLTELVSLVARKHVGCVGAKLLYPNGPIQHAGVLVGLGGIAGHAYRGTRADALGYQNRLVTAQNYSAVTAACLLTPRALFVRLGGFNELYLPVAFNDVDYCLRVKEAGLLVCWTPHVRLLHHESVSRKAESERLDEFAEEIRFMRVRWGRWTANDPAHNPHLSLTSGEIRLTLRWLRRMDSLDTEAPVTPVQRPYALETNMDRVRAVLQGGRSFESKDRESSGLSVVILTLEKPELIGPLLRDLTAARCVLNQEHGIEMQIIVGDTGSQSDEALRIYNNRHQHNIVLEKDLNYHFSKCNNDLFDRHVRFNKALFLNNDIVFSDAPTQLKEICSVLEREPGAGVVGTQLLYPDSLLQHGGIDVFKDGVLKGLCYHPGHRRPIKDLSPLGEIREYPAVTGASLLIRSALFQECGGFDERYETEAQDVDLCFKARRLGWATKLVHVGKATHIENATRKTGEKNKRDRARFIRSWSSFVEADL